MYFSNIHILLDAMKIEEKETKDVWGEKTAEFLQNRGIHENTIRQLKKDTGISSPSRSNEEGEGRQKYPREK